MSKEKNSCLPVIFAVFGSCRSHRTRLMRMSVFCLWQPLGCFSSASLRRVTVSLPEPAPEAVLRAQTKSGAFSFLLTLSLSFQYHNQFISRITPSITFTITFNSFTIVAVLTVLLLSRPSRSVGNFFKILSGDAVQRAMADMEFDDFFSVFIICARGAS